MRILHTSDWHLGRSLHDKKRYDEFSAFLEWLLQTIKDERIDILLVAGDIFDTTTPSNRSQSLYYNFLQQVSTSGCRHVVVIAGNHDSPSFLNAPKALLNVLNVYVVGAITDNLADEVLLLCNNHQPEAIVCAVPYLRDRDIRIAVSGESIDEKNARLVEGLKKHYAEVVKLAEEKRTALANEGHADIPLLAMGHLFTSGGKTIDGDGVRDLYVGSLALMGSEVFPDAIDYLALGHLHVPQQVNKTEHLRYSGSPIAMGYGEAKQKKQVVLIEFAGDKRHIQAVTVPCFQALVRIVGTLESIQADIEQLKTEKSRAWLEIECTDSNTFSHLKERLNDMLSDSLMEILKIKRQSLENRGISTLAEHESLDDLNVTDVFTRCLNASDVAEEKRPELMASYREVIQSVCEEDLNAE
jgi:DNA repair protein SbcD/Mre11